MSRRTLDAGALSVASNFVSTPSVNSGPGGQATTASHATMRRNGTASHLVPGLASRLPKSASAYRRHIDLRGYGVSSMLCS